MNDPAVRVAGKAAAILMLLALISRVLGFLRESFLAAYFGSNWQTDAFFVANVIPVVLFQAAATGVFTNFIPLFVRLESLEGKAAAQEFMERVGTILVLALAGIGLMMWLTAPQLTIWIAPGFHEEAHTLAVTLTRLLVPTMFFQGLTSFFGAVLNARHRFVGAGIIFLLYNLGTILSIVVAGPRWGLVGVTVAINIITFVQAVLTGWLISRAGYRLGWRPARPDTHIRQLASLATPTLIASITAQANVVIDRVLASGLPPGSVSALSFADRINALPVYMFAIPIATVALPAISQIASHWNDDTKDQILNRVSTDLRRATFWVLPVSVAFIVLSKPVTAVLLERGAFTEANTQTTAITLAFFSIGSVFWAWREILLRAFFAMGKTQLPMRASLVTMGVNALLSLLLGPLMGAHGLSLAFSMSMIVNSAWLLMGLRRQLETSKPMIGAWWPKLLAAAALMSLLLIAIQRLATGGDLLLLVAAGIIGGGTFVLFGAFLGIEDAQQFLQPLLRLRQRISKYLDGHGERAYLDRLHTATGVLLAICLGFATIGFTPGTQASIAWIQGPRLGLFGLTAVLVGVTTILRPRMPGQSLLLPTFAIFAWSCVSLFGHGMSVREMIQSDWQTFLLNIVWFGVVVFWSAQSRQPLEALKQIMAFVGYLLIAEGLVCLLFVSSYGEFGPRNPAFIGNPNGYAYLLLVTAPAVWYTLSTRRPGLRGVLLALQTLLILSTGSRGALLVFGFVLGTRLLHFRFSKDLKDVAHVLLGTILGAMVWWSGATTFPYAAWEALNHSATNESQDLIHALEVSGESVLEPLDTQFTRHEEDNVSRLTLAKAGFRVMAAQPAFGAGVTTLGYELESEVRRLNPNRTIKRFEASSTSHGVFPTLGAMFGVPAAMAALWFFGVLAVWLVRLVLSKHSMPNGAFLMTSLAVILPYFLFEDKFFLGSGSLGAFFWAMIGGFNQVKRNERVTL